MSMVDEVKAELEALGHDANRVPESVIQKYLRELGPVGDEESNEKHEEGAELTVSAASPSVNAKLPDDAAAAPIVDSESDDGKSEHAASASATVSSSNSPHRPPRRSDPVAEYASFARSWSKCSSLHSSTPRKRVNFFKRFQQVICASCMRFCSTLEMCIRTDSIVCATQCARAAA